MLKVLIIGAGNTGLKNDLPGSGNEDKIISFAKAVHYSIGFELCCFVEPNYENALLANKYYGVPVYTDIEIAFKQQHIDVVIITTPDKTHYDVLRKVVNYPIKLCICEKPLCECVTEAREIVDLYQEANIPLMLDMTRRYIPEIIDLKRRYDAGEFGKLLDYYIVYNRGRVHSGVHMVDFMDYMFDGNDLIINEVEHIPYRVWCIQLYFEKYFWQEKRIFDDPVPEYFDFHTKYVIDNAYQYLNGESKLLCTGEDGLRALEILETIERIERCE